MGMSISYSIIKDHQGRMKVASKPDVGTRFSIYLPLERDAATNTDETITAPEELV